MSGPNKAVAGTMPNMSLSKTAVTQKFAYFIAATIAIVCAAGLEVFGTLDTQPVIGDLSLLPITVIAALVGLPISRFLEKRGVSPDRPVRTTAKAMANILVLGGILALPPVAIDLVIGFPRDMNMPLPDGLFFYPGIALFAEVVFHLVPLAILALPFSKSQSPRWLIWPVVFVEPVFQLFFVSGPALMSVLVVGNVALVSAVQLWLLRSYGFLAMIGLRLAFYFFWHILWGTARLDLLF